MYNHPTARLETLAYHTANGSFSFDTRLIIWEPQPYPIHQAVSREAQRWTYRRTQAGRYALGWQHGKLRLYSLTSVAPFTAPYRKPALLLTRADGTGRGQREAFNHLVGERISDLERYIQKDIRQRSTSSRHINQSLELQLTAREWRAILAYFKPNQRSLVQLPTHHVHRVHFNPGVIPELAS